MTFKELFGFDPSQSRASTTKIESAAVFVKLSELANNFREKDEEFLRLMEDYHDTPVEKINKPFTQILNEISSAHALDLERQQASVEFLDAVEIAKEQGYAFSKEVKEFYRDQKI